uniref:PicA protein n=1 Tax=Agrobacterium tumefaciens TaxID=358 RepID=Q04300_AGRTU|nr:ORF3 [Agrobacterium tumefaciens]
MLVVYTFTVMTRAATSAGLILRAANHRPSGRGRWAGLPWRWWMRWSSCRTTVRRPSFARGRDVFWLVSLPGRRRPVYGCRCSTIRALPAIMRKHPPPPCSLMPCCVRPGWGSCGVKRRRLPFLLVARRLPHFWKRASSWMSRASRG